MKLLSFGEILWDIYPDKKYIGGAPLNFAAHYSRLGGRSYMLTAVGQDELGKEALENIKKFNIHYDYVSQISEKSTGRCLVTLGSKGVPHYDLLDDVAYDYISLPKICENFDILYFGTLALRSNYNISTLKKLIEKNSFKEIFVDINIRPPYYTKENVVFTLENASILKTSKEELETVLKMAEIGVSDFKSICKKLKQKFSNLKIIIITCGEKGSYCFETKTEKEYNCPAEAVDVVSTVGAGDSFSAAFISEYFDSDDINKALNFASKISAFVVSKTGAIPEYDKNLI